MEAKFSHDWIRSYKELVSYAAQFDAMSQPFCRHQTQGCRRWPKTLGLIYDEPTQQLAERFNSTGRNAVRYNEFVWIDVGAFDLHEMDEFLRWIRGLCFSLERHLDVDESQIGPPDPSLMGIRRLAGLYPDFAKSSYAFFPDVSGEPVARFHMLGSPYMGLFMKGEYEVISWSKQYAKLNDKTLVDLLQQFVGARSEL